jgi:hypothetical protein
MKNPIAFIISICFIFLANSCASLKDSDVQHVSSMEGSYYCPKVKLPFQRTETFAEEDVSRVRCYQDEWIVDHLGPRLHRILFQSKNCASTLGKIEAEASIQLTSKPSSKAVLELSPIHCTLIKDEPNWLGEENGKCMLHKLPLHQASPIGALGSCRKAVPAFCFDTQSSVTLTASSPESITVVQNHGSATQVCGRRPQ